MHYNPSHIIEHYYGGGSPCLGISHDEVHLCMCSTVELLGEVYSDVTLHQYEIFRDAFGIGF